MGISAFYSDSMEAMDSLEIDGKEYISSREAARQHSYTTDYVGQLIRKGSLVGKKVGRTWYVEAASLEKYAGEPTPSAKPVMPRTDIFSISERPEAVPVATSKVEPLRAAQTETATSRPLMRYLSAQEEDLPALPVRPQRPEVPVAHIGLDSIVGEAPIEDRYLEEELESVETAPSAAVDDVWGWSETPKEVTAVPKARVSVKRRRAPGANSLAFALSVIVAILGLSLGALSLIAIKEVGFDTTSYSASITSFRDLSNK